VVRQAITFSLLVSAGSACWPLQVAALPPGRAWTPIAKLNAPGFGYLAAPRLEVNAAGIPLLVSPARLPSGLVGFEWADTAWNVQWKASYETISLWPVQSPTGSHHLVWNGSGPAGRFVYMFMGQVIGDSLLPPDTVASVAQTRSEYSAAVSQRRRWVAVADVVANRVELRVFSSDEPTVWREAVAVQAAFIHGVAAATLDDTTAIVAWTDTDGYMVKIGLLRGSTWELGPSYADFGPNRPQFRRRPSGGQWLAWGTSAPHIALATYQDGVWSNVDSLHCAYRDGLPVHYSDTPDMSRDDREYPAIVWAAQDYRALSTVCVCVPTDKGYGIADEIEGLVGGIPTVARDRNGDVWVASWWYFDTVSWLHTYTRATATTPAVAEAGRRRVVAWTLSEAAPETWWAVLRARGEEPFAEMARVQAGSEVAMSWVDDSPPRGQLRYKIRRESVDTRYRWESDEARWPTRDRRLKLQLTVSHSVALGRRIELILQLVGAVAGPLDVEIYDLQGRLVARRRSEAVATSSDSIGFALGIDYAPSAPGVYFARVTDAAGNTSAPAKFVVLD
jgi:hypothetical protein